MERLTENHAYTENSAVDFDNMESVSQRGADSEIIVSGGRVVVGKGLDGSKMWNKYSLNDERNDGMDVVDEKLDFPSKASRFIKGGNAGRRAFPGSHSSRAQIERGDYVKSSAMSDTSETPSLGKSIIVLGEMSFLIPFVAS